jgi:hypothetical protein
MRCHRGGSSRLGKDDIDAAQRTADGQVRVRFKKPNRFGATFAPMTPDAFLAEKAHLDSVGAL